MNIDSIESAAGKRARAVRAIAATLCVLGLVGVVWMHAGAGRAFDAAAESVPPAASSHDFLHAPATASTVPSAESVFGSTPSTSSDDENPQTF
jgi:hypothetical protein